MAPPQEQQRIGPFSLLCHLATGGMAEVWLAQGPNIRGEPLVCVKLMLPGLERDKHFLQMFIEEARLAAPLCHPNLVQIDDLGVAGGRLYLAMEYIRGQALSVLSQALRERGEGLAPQLAASLVAQACRGLDFAHDFLGPEGKPLGLVHRDVSPHNLILRDDGRVKVVDFGIAKATSVSGTRTANLKGKIGYMSPEQIHGMGIDRRTDVFALGVTLWELATGARMFSGANDAEIISRILTLPIRDPREVAPDLPEALAQIALRACARKPASRYSTAGEMAEELEGFARALLPGPPEAALAELAAQSLPPMPRTPEEAKEWARASRVRDGSLLLADTPGAPGVPAPSRSEPTRDAPPPSPIAARSTGELPSPSPTSVSSVATRRRRAVSAALAGSVIGILALLPLALWYRQQPATPTTPVSVAPAPPRDGPSSSQPVPDGYLTLRTNPWANVSLDGRKLGHTPLVKIPLAAGKHTLRLSNERAGSHLYPVEIRSGETLDPGVVWLDALAPE